MKSKKTQTPLIDTDVFLEYKLKNAFIKDESFQKFGTIKDRRNKKIVNEALRLGVDKLVLITAGNNGFSLASLASETSIKVVCIVEKGIDPHTIKTLNDVSHHVIPLNLHEKILRTEEIIAFARERDDEVIWDVSNGFEEAYHSVVKEIVEEKSKVSHIVVPLGSGGIFVGIAEAVESLNLNKKISVIGVGPQLNHKSYADKLSTPWSPYTKAIEYYKNLGHQTYRISEHEIKKSYQLYRNLVSSEPSSTIVFAAPRHHQFSTDDTVVFINSGKSKVV